MSASITRAFRSPPDRRLEKSACPVSEKVMKCWSNILSMRRRWRVSSTGLEDHATSTNQHGLVPNCYSSRDHSLKQAVPYANFRNLVLGCAQHDDPHVRDGLSRG